MSSDGPERTLPVGDAARIDALREKFVRAFTLDSQTRLETFLQQIDEPSRLLAFRELLKTEVKLRRARNEGVEVEGYLARFPAQSDLVRDACAQAVAELATIKPAPHSRRSGLHVRCPACYCPIELVADASLEGISCGSCGSNFSLTTDDDQATRDARCIADVGHFKLIERLGAGAFGAVWKALDTELDRTVAVKIPRAGQLSKQAQDFFFREARSAAQLNHPNIVPVYEVGREGDTLYIVSQLVRGIPLSARLSGGAISARETVELCAVVADALHHAHEQGVIHRDLKPANVMLDAQGAPHLMDFGLARREAREITMTLDGQVLGTPAYMSPEQAQGDAHIADRRSDVYSLGVMLFEMLTGELPFRGNAQMQVYARTNEDPPDPRKVNRHLARDLSTICLKCLERDPNKRYSSARELADDFARFLRGVPIKARPLSRPARLARWAQRKPELATVALLVLLLSVAGPLVALRIEGQRRRLEALVDEKNNLIERNVEDKQKLVAQVDELGEQVKRWEGRANPWALWPPQPNDGPRDALLRGLHQRHFDAVAAAIKHDDAMSEPAICGHIALAQLSDEVNRPADAKLHWEQAANLLQAAIERQPDNRPWRLALADCRRQLARLDSKDKAAALQQLQRASTLLSTSAGEVADPQANLAEIEIAMDSAVLSGFDRGGEALARASQLNESVLTSPTARDPIELYRLTCWLTGKDPILAPPTAPQNGSKATAPPTASAKEIAP